jgi:cytochrome c553
MWSLLGALSLTLAATPADEAFFETKIRPLLVESCVKCHGPDKAGAELRLDSRAGLLKGGDSGPAVVPGKPAGSLLLKAVKRLDGVKAMPPGKQALKAEAVADLEKWIATGAPWPEKAAPLRSAKHWAFEPLLEVVAPTTKPHPVDAFLQAKLQEKGLHAVAPADKRTLIRRATFDLTGLPPTPEEIDAFVREEAPDAFAKLVDRLLASPNYGEKWGRHWLDVVRYADTAGETADYPVPDAWRYRNYVIAAFNRDKPFDQFLREQIAGDILAADAPPERFAELVTATGYIAIARRFGFDSVADHNHTIDDTIDTLGKSVLGLAIGCARCHDHKYDPISAADYYALYGIFDSTRYPAPGSEKDKRPHDMVPLMPAAEYQSRLQPFQEEVKRCEQLTGDAKERDAAVKQAKQRLEQFARSIEKAYAVAEGKPHNVRLHKRGDPASLGDEVPRRFLQFLGDQPVPPNAGSGRLQLAGWLTDAKNPLTARVIVNRVWQGHFGVGLVKTPNDFGTRGAPPSHSELLDYLARRFMADGWSIKAMHRLLMSSEAYRRSCRVEEGNAKVDHDNTFLWRFNRRRLAAEEIRDALLAVSGDLDESPGQGHPFPEEQKWGFTQHAPFNAVYDHNRRSVYLMTQRIRRHPFLALFDGADTNTSTGDRFATTVPTQALFFLNDPFVHARSARLAERLQPLRDDRARLERTYTLLFGRPVEEQEVTKALAFLAAYGRELNDVKEAERPRAAWAAWLRVLLSSNEFLYVN